MDPPLSKRKAAAIGESLPDRNVRPRAESVAPHSRAITVTADQQLDLLLKTLIHLPIEIPFFKETVSNIYELCDPDGTSDEAVLREIPALLKEKGADDRRIAATRTALLKFYNAQYLERIATGIDSLEELGHVLAVILNTVSASNESLRTNAKVTKLKAFTQTQLLKISQPRPSSVQASPAQDGMNIKGGSSSASSLRTQTVDLAPPATQGNGVDELIAEAQNKTNGHVPTSPSFGTVIQSVESNHQSKRSVDTMENSNPPNLDGASNNIVAERTKMSREQKSPTDEARRARIMANLEALRPVNRTGTEIPPRAASADREINKARPRSPLAGRVHGSAQSSPKERNNSWSSYNQGYEPKSKERHDSYSDKLGCFFWNFNAGGCVKSAFECKYAHEPTYWVAPRHPGGRPIRAKSD